MNEVAAGQGDADRGFATVVITCCNRPQQLEQTLGSMLQCDLTGIVKFIIIEDSDCSDSEEIALRLLGDFPHLYLRNPQNIGQIRSVDRAYGHVDTPYIFHCEEDWFFPSSLFLSESRTLLDAFPKIHAVMLRDRAEWPRIIFDVEEQHVDGIGYYRTDPKSHRRWGSFSFNPGLRRLSDYQRFGPFADIGPEREISFAHKLKGFSLASLSAGDVRHIGFNPTEKKDEKARKKTRTYLLKSLKHRLQFAWFKLTG